MQQAYSRFIETAQPELRKRLGNRPIHGNDMDFLPIQAADLLAWNVRRLFYEKTRGQDFVSPVMTALGTIHQEEDGWTRARLENYMCEYKRAVTQRKAALSKSRILRC